MRQGLRFTWQQLRVPVVQAPMAGGANTPALAAAVGNAGGVGGFGFSYSSADKIASDLAAARALTDGPLLANFFVFPPDAELPDEAGQQAVIRALQQCGGFFPEMTAASNATPLCVPSPPFSPCIDSLLEAVWAADPEILTFHFGVPRASWVSRAHAQGISVGASATSVAEAALLAEAGVDFIIAQGEEAGGHFGSFDGARDTETLPCLELVRQLARGREAWQADRADQLPVVAAGGVMNGGDMAAMLGAGAAAVQCGTAFLGCAESGASAAHKRALREAAATAAARRSGADGGCDASAWGGDSGDEARGTVMTRGFSGRRARGIRNEFVRKMADQPVLPFPAQNTLTGALRAAAGARDDGEQQSLWAGTGYERARFVGAGELVELLRMELEAARAET
jgi:nitronate monooxygenase